jgi:hypothetical protein
MERYSIERVDGDRSILEVHEDLKTRIDRILTGFADLKRG